MHENPGRRNNYDRLASTYDRLAKLVFGTAINRAQFDLLGYLQPGSSIIIVGGGTGMLLDELGKMKISPLTIVFVELSEKMLNQARKRDAGPHQVEFVCGDVEHFITKDLFDAVITPFLFDNFTSVKAKKVFDHLNKMLRPGGTWLFTDFHSSSQSPWWQKVLLRTMYRFFKLLASIEAGELPDTNSLFRVAGYECKQEYFYYRKFIRSVVYCKTTGMFRPEKFD